MNIEGALKDLGLHTSQSATYLFLLRHGSSSAYDVSRGTKIARTNCYHILASLVSKSLIEVENTGSAKKYVAKPPKSLLEHARSKIMIASEILPMLELQYRQSSHPLITVLSQRDQIDALIGDLKKSLSVVWYGPKPDPKGPFGPIFAQGRKNTRIKFVSSGMENNSTIVLWEENVSFIAFKEADPVITNIANRGIYLSLLSLLDISST